MFNWISFFSLSPPDQHHVAENLCWLSSFAELEICSFLVWLSYQLESVRCQKCADLSVEIKKTAEFEGVHGSVARSQIEQFKELLNKMASYCSISVNGKPLNETDTAAGAEEQNS